MGKDRFYYDKKFLGSMTGRPLRILSEYLGPLNTLQKNSESKAKQIYDIID